jgi:hypothetical protein
MEEERAFLQDKLRRLEAHLGEDERLKARLTEIQQLEARQEKAEELFDEVVHSFNRWKASVSSSGSETSPSSSDDDSKDDILLLPPPLAFADPDLAVNSVAETCTACEEWPYRPALSLRKPPPCFPHTVFGEWLGGLTRKTPRTEYVEETLPQSLGDGGCDVARLSDDHSPATESPSSQPRLLCPPWSWDWGGWPDMDGGRTLMDKRADQREWPVAGLWDSGWKPPGVRYSLSDDSSAVPWRPRRGEPPDTGALDGLEPYVLQALEWMQLVDSLGLEHEGNKT